MGIMIDNKPADEDEEVMYREILQFFTSQGFDTFDAVRFAVDGVRAHRIEHKSPLA